MDRPPLISFVILTWNSSRTIGETLSSIVRTMADNDARAFEVLVVDNGSTDATLDIVRGYETSARIRVTRLPRNRGTTYPRNLALREAAGAFICVLDSDVAIRSWRVQESLDFISANRCLLAPKLVYPDGSVQHSVKRFPTVTAKLLKVPKILFGIERFARRDFYPGMPFTGPRRVETAISAFWLFPSHFLTTVGLLDEKMFYAPEDIDYCVRVQRAGHPVYYYPALVAVHHTQQISHANPFGRVARSHLFGLSRYFLKNRYWLRAPRFDADEEPRGAAAPPER
jgi:GT2 family glycosyltransferase